MNLDTVRDNLALACKNEGSAINWARKYGVAAAYVSDVLTGRKEPGPKILEPLGIVRVIDYRRVK